MDSTVVTTGPDARAGALQTTEDCRYCWMCRHVCPVGHVTHRETFTPHAWALTIASVKRGALTWNAETADVLYACADCGLCRTHCVTDRPLPDAIAAARAQVVAAGAAPAVVRELDETLRAWGNPYGDPATLAGVLTDLPADAVAWLRGAAASAGADAGARAADDEAAVRGAARAGGIGLFVGDAVWLAPESVAAARTLLAAAGVQVVPIGVGRSTGLLADTLGLSDTAITLARAVLDELRASGCRELLVLSARDRFAFTRVYADRLGLEWPSDVKVTEVTETLVSALRDARLSFAANTDAASYAYHDATHGPRLGRDGEAPRALLSAVLGDTRARRLFWRESRAHPTGATGGLTFTQPAIAAALTDARVADAARVGARWLIADEPADLHELRAHATGVEVIGLYELLAQHLADA